MKTQDFMQKHAQMEVFENMEDGLEIKRRSWEARMTENGKK